MIPHKKLLGCNVHLSKFVALIGLVFGRVSVTLRVTVIVTFSNVCHCQSLSVF